MSSESSFDIVSKMDMQELTNAVHQTEKEIDNRFDFKNSKSSLKLEKDALIIASEDEYKLNAVIDILQSKMVKRGITLKNMDFGKVEPASLGTVRQRLGLKQGIDQENAKKINILIRDSKLKVKSTIQVIRSVLPAKAAMISSKLSSSCAKLICRSICSLTI